MNDSTDSPPATSPISVLIRTAEAASLSDKDGDRPYANALYATAARLNGSEYNTYDLSDDEAQHWTYWAEAVAERDKALRLTSGELLELLRKERRAALRVPTYDLSGLEAWAGTLDRDPTLWGDSSKRLALASGRPTLVFGNDGSGKTTIAGHIVAGALGVQGFEDLLDFPVSPLDDSLAVLVLAFDGPEETRQSWARLGLGIGSDRLTVFGGSPPWDPETATASTLSEFVADIAKRRGVSFGLVVIDNAQRSYGAVARDDRASVLGNALNRLEASGLSVLVLAQSKKNSKPTSKDDAMIGSLGLSGMGSIISLHRLAQGDAESGRPTRSELRHHKGIGSDSTEAVEIHLDLATGRAYAKGGRTLSDEFSGRLEALKSNGLGAFARTDAETLWEVSRSEAHRTLKALNESGYIALDHTGERGTNYYRVTQK